MSVNHSKLSNPKAIATYDPQWAELYEEEARHLRSQFSNRQIVRTEHIGSTAVPGLASRPIIDILIETASSIDASLEITPALEKQGYSLIKGSESLPGCAIMEKSRECEVIHGYRIFIAPGDHPIMESMLFRDHLRKHRVIADRYEGLKNQLVDLHSSNQEAYRDGKTTFIEQIISRAKAGKQSPIIIVDYDPRWVEVYEQEARLLRQRLPSSLVTRVEHYGSTAVPGLPAKPVIDILAEVASFEAAKKDCIPILKTLGYGYCWYAEHMWFGKGYPDGPQKYHLHMAPGDNPVMDGLLFRDYLRKHPETAMRYKELKCHLAELYSDDREEYTDAKGEFVREVTERAKIELRVQRD